MFHSFDLSLASEDTLPSFPSSTILLVIILMTHWLTAHDRLLARTHLVWSSGLTRANRSGLGESREHVPRGTNQGLMRFISSWELMTGRNYWTIWLRNHQPRVGESVKRRISACGIEMGTETFPPVRSRCYTADVLDPAEVRGLFETANDVDRRLLIEGTFS